MLLVMMMMKRVEMTAVMQEINRDPSSLSCSNTLSNMHTLSYTQKLLCYRSADVPSQTFVLLF